jgi:Fe-S-cluster-containing dehydrogenase component
MNSRKRIKLALTRRDFLALGATALGSALAARFITSGPLSPFSQLSERQITGESPNNPSSGPYHWGMVIDLDKCIGCQYCARACAATNDVPSNQLWNLVAPDRTSNGQTFFFTRPCLHCQEAPCVEVCPVRATYRRDDGLIVMDYDRCIGCRYCMVACPYGARVFNWKEHTDPNEFVPAWGIPEVPRRPRGVVEKCTFCIQRIDSGLKAGLTPGVDREATPACVNICPVGARQFGNLKDPKSPVSILITARPTFRLREELGTEASVYYIPPKEGL